MKTKENHYDIQKKNFYSAVKNRATELEEEIAAAKEASSFCEFDDFERDNYEYRFLKDILGTNKCFGTQFDYCGLIHLPKLQWTDSEGTEHIHTLIGTHTPGYYGFLAAGNLVSGNNSIDITIVEPNDTECSQDERKVSIQVNEDVLKELLAPEYITLSGESGTLTDEQFNTLKQSEYNYIWLDNDKVLTLNWANVEGESNLVYSYIIVSDDQENVDVISIHVNKDTKNWTKYYKQITTSASGISYITLSTESSSGTLTDDQYSVLTSDKLNYILMQDEIHNIVLRRMYYGNDEWLRYTAIGDCDLYLVQIDPTTKNYNFVVRNLAQTSELNSEISRATEAEKTLQSNIDNIVNGTTSFTGDVTIEKNTPELKLNTSDTNDMIGISFLEKGTEKRNIIYDNTEEADRLYFTDGTNELVVPKKAGTIATTSDLDSYLPLTGGKITGDLLVTNSIQVGDGTENSKGVEVKSTNLSYLDLGMSDTDYKFRILCEGSEIKTSLYQDGDAGRIVVPHNTDSADKTLATTSDIPTDYIKTSTSETQTINNTSTNETLYLNTTADQSACWLGFKGQGTQLGLLGFVGNAPYCSIPNVGRKQLATTDQNTYSTTAPTAAATDGGIHIVVLDSEPETKYDGYIYMIKE